MNTLTSIFSHSSSSPSVIIPNGGPTLSYPGLHGHVKVFQYQLMEGFDLKPQDVISIVLPNSLEFTVSFFAITLLRSIAAPLNPGYTESEFKFCFEDSKCKLVILPTGWVQQNKPAVKAARDLNIEILEMNWDDSTKSIKTYFQNQNIPRVNDEKRNPYPLDVALLLHTSGTTGRPKGVPLTHKNITTTMMNIGNTYKLTPDDRTLLVMPLFHVHGLIGGMLSTLFSGGTVVIPPKFSATTFWNDFLEYECTWYTAGASKLRFIRSCSSSLAPTVLFELEKTFNAPVLEAYAMTEAAHQMTSNPLPPLKHKPGSVGTGQGVQITILNENGEHVEEGEVCVKGANITLGYLNNASANESSFTKDGWFRTGDQGKFDEEGYLYLTGRIKELINRGGEKISPLELDSILLSHPTVLEAVSFAVPDDIYGQEVHAAVVFKQGQKVTEQDLQIFCGNKVAKFKIPKKFYFIDVMPKTATGKIQRKNISEKLFKSDKIKANL
ncbi:6820_t:CDS:2 [Racocetra fulgida]|uniref:6819_t:CDS:1 n=1 Tax=Racocetra fulgida TaxID=60492 RepID=A0A9N8WLG4_9GLOM|nr:6819_t:CDS:2 [Racocetra fulgida]CAG8490695.1 6820_t:CDS:2 [Racocetra fulgida]